MSNFLKIAFTTLVLGAIWLAIGFNFMPITDDSLSQYFYYTLYQTLVTFLPLSILLFSSSPSLRKVSWFFLLISILIIAIALVVVAAISGGQFNPLSAIYGAPLSMWAIIFLIPGVTM